MENDKWLTALQKRVEEMDEEIAAGNPKKRSLIEIMQPRQMLYNYTMMLLGFELERNQEERIKKEEEDREANWKEVAGIVIPIPPTQVEELNYKHKYPLTPNECKDGE